MSQSNVLTAITVDPQQRQLTSKITPAERAKASRVAQGLPPTVSDVNALRRVATLIGATPLGASEGSGQAASCRVQAA